MNLRPMTQSGRPITGFVRPSTQSGRPGTMEQAIKTPRTAHTARPVTSSSGRFVRLGTVFSSGSFLNIKSTDVYTLKTYIYYSNCFPLSQASMLTNLDGPFINLSRLNLTKYAQKPSMSKVGQMLQILFNWSAFLHQNVGLLSCFANLQLSYFIALFTFPSHFVPSVALLDPVWLHLPSWEWCQKCKFILTFCIK